MIKLPLVKFKIELLQDDGGWTPLVWACDNKHESVIEFLLIRGADPFITDAEGNIAIHWGALSGSRATCELLLNHNCNINSTNNLGETPMHIALRQVWSLTHFSSA